MMILKLELSSELSVSSPVATLLDSVSMPHQPATFSFLKCQFSKSKSVTHSFQAAGWLVLFMELALLHYHEVADSNSTFCFVRMCNGSKKIPSGNADIAFVSNCDHDYN